MVQHQNQRKDMQRKSNKRTSCSPRINNRSDSNYILNQQSIKEEQRHPLLQDHTEALDCLYFRGAQT